MMNDYDEDEERIYEDGVWEWNEDFNELFFISNKPILEEPPKIVEVLVSGPIKFKEDIDILEELRFQRRIQRKINHLDVVTIQDVKDVALFSAPKSILNPTLIKAFHLEATDRFLRALILYFHYFFQVEEETNVRISEGKTKIETEKSQEIKQRFYDDLSDLRLLVAKEYSSIVQGTCGFQKLHHLGPSKQLPSLSKKDAMLFETVLAISIQIIYLALGRINFSKIELETHRLFKSDNFNIAKHNPITKKTESLQRLPTTHVFQKLSDLTREKCENLKRSGKCLSNRRKLVLRSPLIDEVFCQRQMDFRLLGLGVAKYSCGLNPRLQYLESAIAAPEKDLHQLKVNLGIIGLPRSKFDAMLRYLQFTECSDVSLKQVSAPPRISSSKIRKRSSTLRLKVYPNVVLPPSHDVKDFQDSSFSRLNSNYNHQLAHQQQQKWLQFLLKKKCV